jgi:hypothetical protein
MAIDPELIDRLLSEHGHRPQDIAGESGLLKQLTKALMERAMQVELTDHLGYEKHDPAGYKSGNSRNGKSRKKLKGEFGEIELETPRDRSRRHGSSGPILAGNSTYLVSRNKTSRDSSDRPQRPSPSSELKAANKLQLARAETIRQAGDLTEAPTSKQKIRAVKASAVGDIESLHSHLNPFILANDKLLS